MSESYEIKSKGEIKSKEISGRFRMIQACRIGLPVLAGVLLAALLTTAQTSKTAPIPSLTATTDNVSGAHEKIRIDVLRWSTDEERDQFLAAWTLTGGGGRGRGRGGRGANDGPSDPFGSFKGGAAAPVSDAVAAALAPDPTVEDAPRGRGGEAAPRPTPESSLLAALEKGATVGHLWSSEVAGYGIHYAIRLPEPDGGERIILITDRRLGVWNDLWKPVGSEAATNYPFSVIELRLNSKGEGEGKVSLTGKVTVDSAAKTIALENYSALPVVLRDVRRQNPESVRSK
ncbi:MAG: hypothetical protein ABSG41_21620 [Bryobacteraceae bacterium]|jgi:hypothetical protein